MANLSPKESCPLKLSPAVLKVLPACLTWKPPEELMVQVTAGPCSSRLIQLVCPSCCARGVITLNFTASIARSISADSALEGQLWACFNEEISLRRDNIWWNCDKSFFCCSSSILFACGTSLKTERAGVCPARTPMSLNWENCSCTSRGLMRTPLLLNKEDGRCFCL